MASPALGLAFSSSFLFFLMRHFLLSTLVVTAVCMLASHSARAQPGSGGPTPAPAGPIQTPIDGGASLLLASGAAYGLRKLRQRRKIEKSGDACGTKSQ